MLTSEQHKRLELLPEHAKVIGEDRGCPLVLYPAPKKGRGRIVRVLPNGKTTSARKVVVEALPERRIEQALPRLAA